MGDLTERFSLSVARCCLRPRGKGAAARPPAARRQIRRAPPGTDDAKGVSPSLYRLFLRGGNYKGHEASTAIPERRGDGKSRDFRPQLVLVCGKAFN